MKHLSKYFTSSLIGLLVIMALMFLFPVQKSYAQCVGTSAKVFKETFGAGTGYGPPLTYDNGSGTVDLTKGASSYWYWDPSNQCGIPIKYSSPGVKDCHPDVEDYWYTIANSPVKGKSDWLNIADHTGDPNGNMLIVNAAPASPNTFYRRRVRNVCRNTYITFSAWFVEVNGPSSFAICSGEPNKEPRPANVLFSIYDTLGNRLDTVSTGYIHAKPDGSQTWQKFQMQFFTGNYSAVDVELSNLANGNCGNDLAVDDIELDACQPTFQAFPPSSAICLGNLVKFTTTLQSGYNPAYYQWYSSTDGGASYNPIAGDTTGILSVSNVQLTDNGTLYKAVAAGSLADILASQASGFKGTCSVTSNAVPLNVSQASITFGPIPSICQSPKLVDLTTYVNVTGGSVSDGFFSGNGITGNSFDPSTVLQGSTTTITYTYKNPISKCQTFITTNITVLAAPVPSIYLPLGPSVCQGGSVEMDLQNTNAGDAIQWYDPSGAPISGATGIIYNAKVSGTYTVTVTNKGGCQGSASQAVTVNPNPKSKINQGSAGKVCAGMSVTLTTSTVGASNQWTFNNKKIIATNVNSLVAKIDGLYTLAVTTAAGCTDSTSYYLTVNALPTPSINPTSPTTFCPGGSVELDAGGNLASFKSLQWFNNGAAIVPAATGKYYVATVAGNYTLNVTDANGCVGTAGPVKVTIITPPVKPTVAASGPLTVCQGTSLILSVTNFDPANDYQWQKNGITLPGTSSTYSVVTSGTYTVIATNKITKCGVTSSSLVATVNPVPVASVGFTTLTVCTNGNAAHDQVTLTAQVSPAGSYTFQWYMNGAATGAPTTSTTYSATASGNYHFTATSAGGCSGTATDVKVTITPPPTPAIQFSAGYTKNICTPGLTYLELVQPGPTYSSYQWYKDGVLLAGETQSYLKVIAGGNYVLQAVNSNGCVGTSPAFNVIANPPPIAKINQPGPYFLCQGASKTLTTQASSPTVTWWNGNKQLSATSRTITVTTAGNYYFTYTDAVTGCKATSNVVAINVHANPPANLFAVASSGSIKLCAGNTIVLHLFDKYTVDSALFEWHHYDSGTGVDNILKPVTINDSTYTVGSTPSDQGDYYAIITYVPSGCSRKSNLVNVQFNKPPIATLGGGIICPGGTITLTSPPGVSFQWYYSATDAPLPAPAAWTVAPGASTSGKYVATQPGFYKVFVTDGTTPVPCSNYSDTIRLTRGHLITVSVDPKNQQFCKGSFIQLTATVKDSSSSTVLDPTGTFYNYQWFLNGNPVSGGAFNTIGADSTGAWSVMVSANGTCTGSDVTNVTVHQPIRPILSPSPKVVACEGSPVLLTVTNAASFSSLQWLRNGVPLSPAVTTTTYSIPPNQFGDYTVAGIDNINSCLDTSKITNVSYQQVPTPNIFTTGPTIFCEGSSTRVYADSTTSSGAPTTDTFQWAKSTATSAGPYTDSVGATQASLTITTPGYYRVTQTTVAGCIGTQNIFIQTFPVVAPVISGTLYFCDSSSTTLTSNLATSEWDYQTFGNYISSNTSIAVTLPGVYILVSRNSSNTNCYKTTSVTVVNKPVPKANFTMADSCQASNTVLFVNTSTIADGSVLSYNWNFGNIPSGPLNTATTTDGTHDYPAPVAPATYPVTLTATNAATGCTSSIVQNFLFKGSKPVASFVVTGGGKVCAGQPSTLQDNSTINTGTISTFAWAIYDAAGNRMPIVVDSVISPSVQFPDSSSDAMYTVIHTVIGNSGCQDITSKVITVTGTLKAYLKLTSTQACLTTAPDSLRGGTPKNGTAGGIGAYSGPGVKAGIFYPGVAGVGKHTIVYTFLNPSTGCSSVATDTINVQMAPAVVNLSVPPTYKPCDTSVLLTATGTGATLYSWYIGTTGGLDSLIQTGPQDTLRTAVGGNFRVRISNKYGCYSDASLPVTLYPHPKPIFDLVSICSNLVATFSDSSTISDKSGLNYQWDFGDPASGVNNTTTSPVPVHQYMSKGIKTVTLTLTSNKGCVQALSKKFAISNIDSLVNFTIRTNSPFCVKEPIVFIDSSSLPNRRIRSYRWIFLDQSGTVLPLTSDTTGLVSVVFPTVTVPTKFTVREMIITTDGCPLQGVDRTIIINPVTPVTYVREHARDVCRLDPPFPLTGGVTVPPGQPGRGYYTGAGILDSATFNPINVTGGDNTVSYVFTNQYGCVSTASTEYTVHDTLVLAPRVTSFNVLEGDQVTLNGIATLPFTFGADHITSINADSLKWSWSPGTGLSSTTAPVPTLTAGVTTTYTLTVTPSFGCPSRVLFVVVVHKRLNIPNAFSPNGDGNNDTWIIQGIDNYPNAEVYIFNRWGQQLWYSKGYGIPWNGFFNGKPLPMGTYYYLIKLNKVGFEQPLSGPLTIIY